MRKGCYDCARAEWDLNGAICGINGMHIDQPSLGCNKRIPEKRMTNGDRIRQMTDEELAGFLNEYTGCRLCDGYQRGICNSECLIGHLIWLRKEASWDERTEGTH